MMKAVVMVGAVLLFVSTAICSEIVVQQDKNGTITVSNRYTNHNFTTSESKRVRFVKGAGGSTVPLEYRTLVKQLAKKYKVREQLIIAVARAESGFNPFAVSHKGAVGIMQLMPETAAQYGVVNRYNGNQNLEAGVRHLRYLYEKYKDIPLTLAAYNAGEEAVKKYKGVPPYKETRTYIKRIMSYMGLSYNSGSYKSKSRNKRHIYRIVSNDGKITITDTLPSKVDGTVTILD